MRIASNMRSATGVVDRLLVMVDVEGALVDVTGGDVLLVAGGLFVVVGRVVVAGLTVVTGGVVGDFSVGVVVGLVVVDVTRGLDVVVVSTVAAVDVFGADVLAMVLVVLVVLLLVVVVVLVGAFDVVDEDLLGVGAVVKAVVPAVEFREPRAVVAFAVVVFGLLFLAVFP